MDQNNYENDANLKELQEITFAILEYFKGVCSKLGLRYYLAYGTLLGAIRHKGFIPWDDDIDVWMQREDFMALLDYLYKNEDERYVLSHGEYQVKGEWPEKLQMKILDKKILVERQFYQGKFIPSHPWIDIFALDNAPDDHKEYMERILKKRKYYQLCRGKHMKYAGARLPHRIVNSAVFTLYNKFHLLRHVLNEDKASDRMFDEITSYRNKESGKEYFCNDSTSIHTPSKCFFKKEWFKDMIEMPYGSGSFAVPSGYDEILKTIYGDYMTPPPPENRHGRHFGKILERNIQ